MSNDLFQSDSSDSSGFDLDLSGESPRTSIFDSLDTTPAFTFPVEEVPKQIAPSPVAQPAVETPETVEPASPAPEAAAVAPHAQGAGIRRTIETPEPRQAKRRPFFKWVFILLLLGGASGGGWFLYNTVFQGANPATEIPKKQASTKSEAEASPEIPVNPADNPTPPAVVDVEPPPLPETPIVPDDNGTPPAPPEFEPDIPTGPSDGTDEKLRVLLKYLNNSNLVHLETRKETARLCNKKNNFSLAEEFLTPLLDSESEDGEACFLMGIAKRGQGASRTAIEHFRQSIERGYNIAESHYQCGLAYLIQEDAESAQLAIDEFTEAVSRDPLLADAWFQRALLKQAGEQPEDAINDLTEVLKLEPANLDAVVHRANLFHITDKPAEAIEDYGTAIDLDPENYRHWKARALLRKETGDNNGAMSDLGESIKLRE